MSNKHQKATPVCVHWKAGRCTRLQCRFLHSELQGLQQNNGTVTKGIPNFKNTWRINTSTSAADKVVTLKKAVVCKFWLQGDNKCRNGNDCRFLHSWTTKDCGFTLLKQLEGHQKGVTGIALSESGDLLYSGSMDKTIRSWDCHSGQNAGVFSLDCEVGCMLSEGQWIFVGLTNLVKAQNTQIGTLICLSGPVFFGRVHVLAFSHNNLLLAGTENGYILAWKYNNNNGISTFEQQAAGVLKGHTDRVTSLVVGGFNRLYSSSRDSSIRVWSLETMQCLQVLTDHTSEVTSILCWDQYLLSCSLDKTVKVWAPKDSGNIEVIYTHQEEHPLLTLFGMNDSEAKPVLFCSCADNTIRARDLPSFSERGKIFSKEPVRRIVLGPAGLFFTGDESGHVRVWRWLTESSTSSAN